MEHGELTMLKPEEILARLDTAILAEIQAVADYKTHAQAVPGTEIGEALAALRDVECEHALRLAARIAALGGSLPSSQPKVQAAGRTLADWLTFDLTAEQWAIVEYARLVTGIVDDDETAELIGELLQDEIRHARWLKSTLREIEDRQ